MSNINNRNEADQKHEDSMQQYDALKTDHYRRLAEAGLIKQEALNGCRVYSDRYISLESIPKGGVVAEVGVAFGDYSKTILEQVRPLRFYAIDYFNQDDPYAPFGGRDDFKRDNMPHQQWYENKFHNEIEQGLVIVKQGLSWDVLKEIEDNYFDFIYLDAAHDYESVVKDIEQCHKKIKNGGLIQFNDYIHYDANAGFFYGTVPVINRLINSGNHKVTGFCLNFAGYYDIIVKIYK